MDWISEHEEALIREAIADFNQRDYHPSHFAQGAFLFALDLRDHADELGIRDARFQLAVEEALDTHEWARDLIHSNQLPTGFARAAAQGRIELPTLDAPELDHEWLLMPGRSLIDDIVEEHYELFCKQSGLLGRLESITDDVSVEFLIAVTILNVLATSGTTAFIPFAVACGFYIAYYELDEICNRVTPMNP